MPLALGVLSYLTARKTSFINDSKGAVRKRGWNRAPAPSHNRTHFNMRSSNVSIKGYRNWSYFFKWWSALAFRAPLAEHKSTKKYGNTSTCPPSRRPSEWPFYDMENKRFHPASEINVLSCPSSQSTQDWGSSPRPCEESGGHVFCGQQGTQSVTTWLWLSHTALRMWPLSAVTPGGWRWGWRREQGATADGTPVSPAWPFTLTSSMSNQTACLD